MKKRLVISIAVFIVLMTLLLVAPNEPESTPTTQKLKLLKPVVAGIITGRFNDPRVGHLHNGVDFAVPVGTAVMAPEAGIVTSTGWHVTGGNQLFIKHDNGWVSGFAHLSKFVAKKGQRVNRGQEVARSGNTGYSTGPHLHWSLTVDGQKVDPLKFI